jgi:hypothetical protein
MGQRELTNRSGGDKDTRVMPCTPINSGHCPVFLLTGRHTCINYDWHGGSSYMFIAESAQTRLFARRG